MRSKVKSVQANGTWNAKDGSLLYKFDYEFEDSETLQASHKSPDNAFKVGDDVEYEIKRTHPTYGNSGSVKKVDDYQSAKQNDVPFKRDVEGAKEIERMKNPSFALSYSKDFCLGVYNSGARKEMYTAQEVTEIADVFLDWLNSK